MKRPSNVVVLMVGVVLLCLMYLLSGYPQTSLVASDLSSPFLPAMQLSQPDSMQDPSSWRRLLCKSNKSSTSDYKLPWLLRDIVPKSNDKNVFLVETACNTHPRYRDWCSVESWARQNPDLEVWYLFTSLTADNSDNLVSLLLQKYSNLRMASVDLDKIFLDTPLDTFFTSKRWIIPNMWPANVLSNMLRALVLWNWGGIYSDTDILCIKNFTLPINAVDLYKEGKLNGAFLSFTVKNPFMWALMKDINEHFQPTLWGSSGPHALTRVMKERCKNATPKLQVVDGKPQSCNNITIYPNKFFSPVHFRYFQHYFDDGKGKNFTNDFKSTFLIHFWNKLSKTTSVKAGKDSIYDVAARTFCPLTYQQATLRSNHF